MCGHAEDWVNVNKKKLAAQREPDQVEIISGIKGALNCQNSNFSRRISNAHKLRDLDYTFQELGKVA